LTPEGGGGQSRQAEKTSDKKKFFLRRNGFGELWSLIHAPLLKRGNKRQEKEGKRQVRYAEQPGGGAGKKKTQRQRDAKVGKAWESAKTREKMPRRKGRKQQYENDEQSTAKETLPKKDGGASEDGSSPLLNEKTR